MSFLPDKDSFIAPKVFSAQGNRLIGLAQVGLKGQLQASPGQSAAPALGQRSPSLRSPERAKQENKIVARQRSTCFALSGLAVSYLWNPGRRFALPWDDMFQPFGLG
ncbi:MAG: hypothetical protein O3C40_15465 [Planctomycetota bacterium]|nr:hypothetical protein [Planctomycetota bacterium]